MLRIFNLTNECVGYTELYCKDCLAIPKLIAQFFCLKEFNQALTFGRIYYSIKRKGIMGAGGGGLTIYDESAINNDISAYSKV
jgi:hypothetical protein